MNCRVISANCALLLGFFSSFCFAIDASSISQDTQQDEFQYTPPSSSILEQFSSNQLVTEADYLNAIPVVLSATRMLQPVNTAPASITVISRDMIDASGAQEIGDLLRLVPGFQVGYFNGTSMSLTYHGFTGNYDPINWYKSRV